MLHEILAQPPEVGLGEGYNMKIERHGSEDSGYFSRRGSKATIAGDGKRDSVLTEAMEDIVEDYEGAEEADDEGAELEDPEEEEDTARTKLVSPFQTQPTEHRAIQTHPHHEQSRVHIASRFLFPAARKPASPLLSADEAVVARAGARDRKGAPM